MKKKRILILIFLCILVLSGCQKTPGMTIVKGKNIDNLIDKATENPITADRDSHEELKRLLGAPERFILETQGKKGNLKISADGDIVVPNTRSMPVARVARAAFTQGDVERLFNVFGKDAQTIDPNSLYTSEYYLNEVKKLREGKKDLEEKLSQDPEALSKELGIENVEDYIEETINQLLKQAAEAPENYVEIEPDFTFKEYKDEVNDHNGIYARLRFKGKGEGISEIIAFKENPDFPNIYAEYYRDRARDNEVNRLETHFQGSGDAKVDILPIISMEEAQRIADDTISALGLDDFTCGGSRITPAGSEEEGRIEVKGFYEFMFTRKINNVPINYTDDEGLTTVHEAYHEPWMYERIRMFIDEEGVFYMKWASPYEVKEIVSQSSSMVPFADIADIFKNMIPMKHDHWDSDERYSYQLKVTEARLGLMRVTEKDVGDSGLIIPVWDFFGQLTYKPKSSEFWEGKEYYTYTSLLTINAIDGSIIDRDLGY
ncbi:MAG TPA: DUF6034 family protein [Clostridia bacterium]|nr:DUF6034 family protein [Clostridia bacterium]